MIVQDKASLGMNEFDQAMLKGNPYAIAALLFILKKRAGEAVRWQDMMKLDIRTFRAVFDEDAENSAESDDDTKGRDEVRPDPTSPNGKTRKRATTSTS